MLVCGSGVCPSTVSTSSTLSSASKNGIRSRSSVSFGSSNHELTGIYNKKLKAINNILFHDVIITILNYYGPHDMQSGIFSSLNQQLNIYVVTSSVH